MALTRRIVRAADVRTPEVVRGEVVVVGRYGGDRPKAAIVHPDDLAELEAAVHLVESVGRLEKLELSDAAQRAHALEDRPAQGPVEDPDRLKALLGL